MPAGTLAATVSVNVVLVLLRLCAPTVGETPVGKPAMLSATGAVNAATFDTVMAVCAEAPGATVSELGLSQMPMSAVTTTSVVAVFTRPASVAVAVTVKLPAGWFVAALKPTRKIPPELAPTDAVTPAGSPVTTTTGFGVTPPVATTVTFTAAVPPTGRTTRLVAKPAVKSPGASVVTKAPLPIVVDPSERTRPAVVVVVADGAVVVDPASAAPATVLGPPAGGTVSSSFAGVSPLSDPGVRYASFTTSVKTVLARLDPLVPVKVIRYVPCFMSASVVMTTGANCRMDLGYESVTPFGTPEALIPTTPVKPAERRRSTCSLLPSPGPMRRRVGFATTENPGVDLTVCFTVVFVVLFEVDFFVVFELLDEEPEVAAFVVAGFEGSVGPTAPTVLTPSPIRERVVAVATAATAKPARDRRSRLVDDRKLVFGLNIWGSPFLVLWRSLNTVREAAIKQVRHR